MVLSFTPATNLRQYALFMNSGGTFTQLTRPPAGWWDSSVSFRADGKSVVFIRATVGSSGVLTKLMVVDINTLQTRELISETGCAVSASYAPEGNKILVWAGQGLEIVPDDASSQNVILLSNWLNGRVANTATWLYSGTGVVFGVTNPTTNKAEIFVMNLDGTHIAKSITSFPAMLVTAIRSPRP